MVLTMMHDMGDVANSPFIVPVAGCIMIAVIVVAGNWSGARKREIESQERLAAIARGVPVPPSLDELAMTQNRPTADVKRRHANIRLTGIILLAGGVGLVAFFIVLSAVLHVREVLCGAAAGLIPLGLGAGFLIDAGIQKKDIEATSATAGMGDPLR